MSTRPEYEEVTNPANTVGKWSKGAPTSESFTKPIFINEGDAELPFTVPVMTPVANFGKTVPQIEVEGNSPPTVFFIYALTALIFIVGLTGQAVICGPSGV